MEVVSDLGITKVHVFPYSPRPGTRTAGDDPVPQQVKRERSAQLRAASDDACRARWRRRVGTEDVVLVDRPGLGYADDYTPWLLDAPVGTMARARAVGVSGKGVLAVVAG
jgi:threonylcarbamoyladenosine tRNA methylthiotransferase MtaB